MLFVCFTYYESSKYDEVSRPSCINLYRHILPIGKRNVKKTASSESGASSKSRTPSPAARGRVNTAHKKTAPGDAGQF
jgi:hypothetical protein